MEELTLGIIAEQQKQILQELTRVRELLLSKNSGDILEQLRILNQNLSKLRERGAVDHLTNRIGQDL